MKSSGTFWVFLLLATCGRTELLQRSSGAGSSEGASPEAGAVDPGVIVETGNPGDGLCLLGETVCDGKCVNTQTATEHCSGCGKACSVVAPSKVQCAAARCLVTLASAQASPWGIALDASNVYWTTFSGETGRVMAVPLGGGKPTNLASGIFISVDIAVDARRVYWTDTTGRVMTVPLGGGDSRTIVSDAYRPFGIAVNRTNVFWADSGRSMDDTVMTAPLDGGTATTLAFGQIGPYGIAVGDTSVFWTDANDKEGRVMTVPLNGGTPTLLAAGSSPSRIIADATSVYWTDIGAGTVMKVSQGGGATTVLASGQLGPFGIAMDATHVYWTNYNGQKVMKVPLEGGAPTTLASSQGTPFGIAVDASNVYWTDVLDGAVRMTPK